MLCPPLGIDFLFLQIANGYQCAEYIDNWYGSPKRDTLFRLTWMIPLGEFIKINYLYRNLRAICHALGFFFNVSLQNATSNQNRSMSDG